MSDINTPANVAAREKMIEVARLKESGECKNIPDACERVGISTPTYYEYRKRFGISKIKPKNNKSPFVEQVELDQSPTSKKIAVVIGDASEIGNILKGLLS